MNASLGIVFHHDLQILEEVLRVVQFDTKKEDLSLSLDEVQGQDRRILLLERHLLYLLAIEVVESDAAFVLAVEHDNAVREQQHAVVLLHVKRARDRNVIKVSVGSGERIDFINQRTRIGHQLLLESLILLQRGDQAHQRLVLRRAIKENVLVVATSHTPTASSHSSTVNKSPSGISFFSSFSFIALDMLFDTSSASWF